MAGQITIPSASSRLALAMHCGRQDDGNGSHRKLEIGVKTMRLNAITITSAAVVAASVFGGCAADDETGHPRFRRCP